MNKEKFEKLMANNSLLPNLAFAILPSDEKQVIAIRKGDNGYFPYTVCADGASAEFMRDYKNEQIGVSEEEAEAMLCKSLFGGWDK